MDKPARIWPSSGSRPRHCSTVVKIMIENGHSFGLLKRRCGDLCRNQPGSDVAEILIIEKTEIILNKRRKAKAGGATMTTEKKRTGRGRGRVSRF